MNKSTLIAILAFVGLAVAATVTMREKPERGVARLSLDKVDVAAVDQLLIGADDGIRIERKDGHWTLDSRRAEDTAVAGVVESIAGVRSSELASRNPDRYAELEVDDEKGTRVRLLDAGTVVADLIVGGVARGGSYVRAGDDVYAVRGIYRASLARDREGWIERRLFFDEVDKVERLEVAVQGATPYAVVKTGGSWQLEDPSLLAAGWRFDSEAAARLVRSLVSARADKVLAAEPETATGLDSSVERLQYRVGGEPDPRVLTLGATADGSVFARSSSREHIVTLPESIAQGLRKTLGDLRDFRIVALDPQQVKRLAIEDGSDQLVLEKKDGGWAIATSTKPVDDDFDFDPDAVMRRLGAVGRATALAEGDPGQALDVSTATAKIAATLADDSVVVVAFGPEGKLQERDVVTAVGNVDDRTYLVDKSTRNQLLAGIESFKRTAPVAPAGGLGQLDPAALQNLPPDVRDSLLKQMAEEQQRQEMMKKAMEAAGQ